MGLLCQMIELQLMWLQVMAEDCKINSNSIDMCYLRMVIGETVDFYSAWSKMFSCCLSSRVAFIIVFVSFP